VTRRGTWQKAERDTARALHGERNRMSGSVDQLTSGDVVHPVLYVEHKYAKRHAVLTLHRSVREKAAREGKVPVVVLQEAGNSTRYYLVDEQALLEVAAALIDE